MPKLGSLSLVLAIALTLLPLTASEALLAFGSLQDPAGDAVDCTSFTCSPKVEQDIVSASVRITRSGDAILTATYAPGTSLVNTFTQFELDGPTRNNFVNIYGSGFQAGTDLGPAIYSGQTVQATVPLSLLGLDSGVREFAVESAEQLRSNRFTPVVDFAPDQGEPPAVVANLCNGVPFSDLFFPCSVTMKVTNNNQTMTAEFKPVNGMTLNQVANATGYDHFNWLQLVTAFPDPFALNVPVGSMIPTILTPPFFDPPLGGGSLAHGPADQWPFYWDESSTLNDLDAHLLPFMNPSLPNTTLTFRDSPSWVTASESNPLAFLTALVGVFPDKTYDILDVFTWKTSYNGTAGGISLPRNTSDPDLLSGTGGIFELTDVTLDQLSSAERAVLMASGARNLSGAAAVPGPSTLMLVLAGWLTFCIHRRKGFSRRGASAAGGG